MVGLTSWALSEASVQPYTNLSQEPVDTKEDDQMCLESVHLSFPYTHSLLPSCSNPSLDPLSSLTFSWLQIW